MNTPNVLLEDSQIKVSNIDIVKNCQKTYITSPITAGVSTLIVQNIVGAEVNGYILIGKIGSEKSEIVQIHATTAPSGSTITLKATELPLYNHPTDTTITFIPYNQVEISRATTTTGSKSVLSTMDIAVDQEYSVYNDTTNSTGYAFARWKNESFTTYSGYSTYQAYPSMERKKIGTLIDSILLRIPNKLSRSDVFGFIKDGLDEVYESKDKWSFEESTRDTTNSYATGTEEFTIPSDLKENKNEYIIWIGAEGKEKLEFIDVNEFNNNYAGQARTTLNGDVLAGATSIVLTDSSNFADSGTGYIGSDEFTWTGKTASTHTLTGVSGILTHDSGSVVVSEGVLGTPDSYTIWNGVGRLYPIPDSDNNGKRLIIEYYKNLADINTENDYIPTAFFTPIRDYVLSCVSERMGEMTKADRYYQRFMMSLQKRKSREKLNEYQQMQVLE